MIVFRWFTMCVRVVFFLVRLGDGAGHLGRPAKRANGKPFVVAVYGLGSIFTL